MSFRDDLLRAGYHTRFHRATFMLREDDPALELEPSDGEPDPTDQAEDTEPTDEEQVDPNEGEDDPEGLTLTGRAVPFDSPTRIDNFFEGTFDEQFRKGAFTRTIGIGGQVMLFEHGEHPLFGSLPIANLRSLTEKEDGLYFRAHMFDNWLTVPLQDAIRSPGGISGVSIQFRAIKEEIEERDDGNPPLVSVTEAELRELGPVLFPAYADTSIELRKKIVEDVRRSFEATLAGYGGGSRGADNRGSKKTGPGSSHPVRFSLAIARLHLAEVE